jgi:O-antigen ligase
MIHATRVIVVASTVLAAFAEAYLATAYWPPQTIWLATASLVVMALIGSRVRFVALPLVLSMPYVMPALLLVWRGNENSSLDFFWMMPLLGLVLSGPGVRSWSLPARWQWPLITWAVIVAISWPIVFLRETDFALWVLPLSVSNTSIGVNPWEVNQNVTYFAVVHTLGILWIDALCRWYAGDRERFIREVVYPLAATAAIGSIVAIYQGFVDLSFLNRGFWTYMLRAAGTHGDPNRLGAVAAFWALGTVVLARRFRSPWSAIVGTLSIVAGVGAVWISGSRTGLAAIAVGLTIAAYEAIRASRMDARRLATVGIGALVLAAAVVVVLQNASTHTVGQRGTWGYLPFFGDRGIVNSANELLWERFGYGPAAIEMIKEHPIEGVGVGMFHTLVHDFGTLRGYRGENALTTDNAQNWLRHILAEQGIVGSIPVVWWCVLLAMLLFTRGGAEDRLSTGLLRGALIGFAVASIFGMPGQAAAVAVTFWAFVFWLMLERGSDEATPASGAASRWSRPATIAAVVLIAAHAGMTVVDARGDLWPRNRSMRFGWFYKYGMSEPEPDPGGNPVQRRWTIMPKSLAVVPVNGTALKFVAWIDHPDGDERPVKTKVWADGTLVFDGEIRRSAPLFMDIPATSGRSHLILETEIDRLWAPRDYGQRDPRALGLSIRDWAWE